MHLSDLNLDDKGIVCLTIDQSVVDEVVAAYTGFSVGRFYDIRLMHDMIVWVDNHIQKLPRESHFLFNSQILVRTYRQSGMVPMAWCVFDVDGELVGGQTSLINDRLTFLNQIVMRNAIV